jgi:anhydro-N-acetylmuramic acid kinase
MPAELYIGLMSGTSLDGVDGVLAAFDADGAWRGVQAHAHRPFDADLREELLALNQSGADELHRAACAAWALMQRYADVVSALLEAAGRRAGDIRAIGAHGQTVRHRPKAFEGGGYTLQLSQPARLAELCGIDVVADLRARDVAAGGQGAPLVPAFHRAVFGRNGATVAVVNIGGIGNLSVLGADGAVIGFDTGPGNALMDGWCVRHHGEPFDRGGAWAATGRVDGALLAAALAEPYFGAPPPKSTGRDDFHLPWLDRLLAGQPRALDPRDVQSTLCELTAQSIADAVLQHAAGADDVLVCGGGALNTELMRRLATRLAPRTVASTAVHGLGESEVEAAAFAWLAWAHVHRVPGNLPSVTGAHGPRLLGALYPA